MTLKRLTIWLILLALLGSEAMAQVTYLASFDKQKVHYGIQLGYTQSKFKESYTQNDEVRETLQGTTSYYAPGFHLAVLGDLRLGNYFNLRALPGLTLVTRSLNYNWETGYYETHGGLDSRRNVESVYGEIPIELKFRAFRYRNFRPYLTGGMSYGFDFASLRNNKNNNNQSIVRLNTSDLRYTTGVGFDFYLRYVKFAIELKMSFGLLDLRIEDKDIYTQSVDNLKSRTFMLSFTFEG
ncbi:MAG: outer membrane beta-barrel protein [Bacteroidales bacterium]|nr:outer membrane beta-barrel protein [Bacteroidales bacterium]